MTNFYQSTDAKLNQIQQDNEFKDIIASCGATLLNQYPYQQMYKQSLARIKLLDKIRLYHTTTDINDVQQIDPDINFLLSLHYNCVLPVIINLDINNTIDHTSETTTEWSKYITENPAKLIMQELKYPPKPKAYQDEATKQLLIVQNKSRASYMKQRIHHQMKISHQKGWFVVFDTLTLSPDKVKAFYDNPNAIRDYTRNIGRKVNQALGLPARAKYTDNYQYICVPEYGTQKGRLHFHLVHLLKALPKGTIDPIQGRTMQQIKIMQKMKPSATDRAVNTLRGMWNYGMTMPIAVRYTGDAYKNKLGWLHPIDTKSENKLQLKPLMAVGHYIAKYINKSSDQDLIKKQLTNGNNKWTQELRKTLNKLPTHTWKIRTSRGFGMDVLSMKTLPMATLAELTKLHWSVTPISSVLKKNAQKEIKSRLGTLTVRELPALLPETINLLTSLRTSMSEIQEFSQLNSTSIMTPKLLLSGISNLTEAYLNSGEYIRETNTQSKNPFGSK